MMVQEKQKTRSYFLKFFPNITLHKLSKISGRKNFRKLIPLFFVFLTYDVIAQSDIDINTQPIFNTETEGCKDFIKIDGSTNVNQFYFIQKLDDNPRVVKSKNPSNDVLILKIPAHDFEPSNPMMYKDFLDFIKAKEFPYIDITIFFDNLRLPVGNTTTVVPKIKVGLAGHTQTYEIPGYVNECLDKELHIKGKVKINLKDFGLEPPSKFLGMVKVRQEVFINFGFTLEN
ncbi:YceI family protein [Thermophagus xiamenensis]|uniref:YceI-like domain-containing protein n=1 Tax=Thermophagus xiamenensis TaxID=385682 RepID=A0A1I2EZV7_9BACT|nr:YceI family protein [Thermophagus xiamenensis]SFE98299.1 hypothetical protein SAMN05444380_12545 [Thermophagus xiamenensis]